MKSIPSLDERYFAGIESARSGVLDGTTVGCMLDAATKFVAIDLPEEAARYFERVLQIWLTWSQAKPGGMAKSNDLLLVRETLEAYLDVLARLSRPERAQAVAGELENLAKLMAAVSSGSGQDGDTNIQMPIELFPRN